MKSQSARPPVDPSLYTAAAFAKLCYICDYKISYENHNPTNISFMLDNYRIHKKCQKKLEEHILKMTGKGYIPPKLRPKPKPKPRTITAPVRTSPRPVPVSDPLDFLEDL